MILASKARTFSKKENNHALQKIKKTEKIGEICIFNSHIEKLLDKDQVEYFF